MEFNYEKAYRELEAETNKTICDLQHKVEYTQKEIFVVDEEKKQQDKEIKLLKSKIQNLTDDTDILKNTIKTLVNFI